MNTISLESLLITEEEWVATEGLGSMVKKAGSAVWGAIKTLCKKILNAINTLIGKIKGLIGSLRRKQNASSSAKNTASSTSNAKQMPPPTSNPQNERWKNVDRDQFMKSKQKLVGGVEVKPDQKRNPPTPTQAQQKPSNTQPVQSGPLLLTNTKYKGYAKVEVRSIMNAIVEFTDKLDTHIIMTKISVNAIKNPKGPLEDKGEMEKYKAERKTINEDRINNMKKLADQFPPIHALLEQRKYDVEMVVPSDCIGILEHCSKDCETLKRNAEITLQRVEKLETIPNFPKNYPPIFNLAVQLLARDVSYIRWQTMEIESHYRP